MTDLDQAEYQLWFADVAAERKLLGKLTIAELRLLADHYKISHDRHFAKADYLDAISIVRVGQL